jgi:hypothetical protein
MIISEFKDFRMNATSWLTVLGVVIGSSTYAAQNQIYPQYTGAIATIGTIAAGVLAKGIEKK